MNVIELQHVSVRYRRARVHSLKEALVRGFSGHPAPESFSSLRDVSLAVRDGEAVAIVGPNGAGKSTLLRVAAGIIAPSEGVAVSRGSVAPIIELGTGFEYELSGRENILFNGALLGLTRAYMRSRTDEIVDFSGLEDFIDQPLRTYSSGMVARLAFAIATSVEAETILLDEILAVGDAEFRRRCDERIAQFVRSGRTVVAVSHDLEAVRDLCPRAVWLAEGAVVADGPSSEVIERYRTSAAARRHAGTVRA